MGQSSAIISFFLNLSRQNCYALHIFFFRIGSAQFMALYTIKPHRRNSFSSKLVNYFHKLVSDWTTHLLPSNFFKIEDFFLDNRYKRKLIWFDWKISLFWLFEFKNQIFSFLATTTPLNPESFFMKIFIGYVYLTHITLK